mmetsp:Transcript_104058/g.303788  ORF Transcript_104058/g.303788 Transcript_104058/m.303788 type:complete len:209 (-) Transcript_104058:491-1117(-)
MTPFFVWKVNCVSGGEKTCTLTAMSVSLAFLKLCSFTAHSISSLTEPSGRSFCRSTSLSPGKSSCEKSCHCKLPFKTLIQVRLPRPTMCGGTPCPGLQQETTTEKRWSVCTRCCTQWNSLKCAGLAYMAHSKGLMSAAMTRSKARAQASLAGSRASAEQRPRRDWAGVGGTRQVAFGVHQSVLTLTMGARRGSAPVGGNTRQSEKGGE